MLSYNLGQSRLPYYKNCWNWLENYPFLELIYIIYTLVIFFLGNIWYNKNFVFKLLASFKCNMYMYQHYFIQYNDFAIHVHRSKFLHVNCQNHSSFNKDPQLCLECSFIRTNIPSLPVAMNVERAITLMWYKKKKKSWFNW
jgi:hypothetical protein